MRSSRIFKSWFLHGIHGAAGWSSWTSRSTPRILPQQTVIPASTHIFSRAANAITLRTDLKVCFYNHNFTDRVIIPPEMGNVQKLLPVHLPRHPDCDAGDALFFRLHLRASITFMLLEEDISEKYPPHRILGEMGALGVSTPGGDPDFQMAPLTNERWQTELGKAILADVMRVRTQPSIYHSEQSYSDSTS
ncbi:hypothetical protein B0H14DRAFT_3426034 [Mycena olivaceomarginata]|nr:hypothetical protein B0H14DRAFT_3426034 [Mycena olivaceomarginata]